MSTPLTSTGPTSPEQSSQGVPVGGFRQWFVGITDWVKGLSPAGATQYDTGWVVLPLNSGYQANGVAPAVRRIGKDIEFRGLVQPNPAGPFPTSANVTVASSGSVPSGYRASYQILEPMCGDSAISVNGGRVVINTDGSIQINTSAGATPYYSLFGLRYKVD